MFFFFATSSLSLKTYYATSPQEMNMRPITSNTRQIASSKVSSLDEISSFLTRNGITKSLATKISEQMKFATQKSIISHVFRIQGNSFLQWRPVLRTSTVIKASKEGNQYKLSIASVTASSQVYSITLKHSWNNFLFWKINYQTVTEGRPLTASEITQINDAVEKQVRSKIDELVK